MDKRYQVFVSSTYKDLLEHRQLVIKALMQLTAIPAGMELFPAADDDAWTLIQRAIDESDYYLVIIGGRYGSVDKDGLSFTEKEYDYAEAKGKPIMAFLHEKPDGLPREHTETDPEAWKKLQAFREKAKQRHCKFWKSREELIIGVLTSYQQLTYTHPAAGWVRGDQAKTIEDVERLAELQQQVAELTAENRRLQTLSKDDTSMFQQGDDKLCLTVYSNKRNQQKQTRTIQITWNEVLKALGPSFLSRLADYEVGYIVGGFALERENGVPRAEQADSVGIADEDIVKIRNQFLVLDLMVTDIVRTGTDGRHETVVWKLTERGRKELGRLLALRRVSSNPIGTVPA